MSLKYTLAFIFLLNVDARAQGYSQPPHPPRPHITLPQGVKVPTWEELTPQQRKDLREFANRWNQLPPWQRVRLLEYHAHWNSLPPERREALHAGIKNFQQMSPKQRQHMRHSIQRIHALPPEQRELLKRQWQKMTPEQRRLWLNAGGPGVVPPPPPTR